MSGLTPEGRQRIIEANLGRVLSDEHRAALSKANKDRKLTPEHRAKIAASVKQRDQIMPRTPREKGDAQHGTPRMYKNRGCRCDECRTAWATYRRERKAARS